ncbi:apolipoprotein N-acyltransferase [Hydrogenimonas sp.]
MKFLTRYFTTSSISLGFLAAVGGSAFIYLYHFGLQWPWLQALLGLLALYGWLTLPRPALAWSGFFVGIFWFWWISLSFRYYGLTWMIPLVIAAVGAVYGALFWAVGWLGSPWLRAAALGVVEFVHPFGFDWFRPALLFTGSVLGDTLWRLWIILALLAVVATMRHRWRFLALAALPIAWAPAAPPPPPPLAIELVETHIPQQQKWLPRYRQAIVQMNLHAIDLAAEKGKKAVVLPESAFPLYLNRDIDLMQTLLRKSRKITIVTGALFWDQKPYNSTYLFRGGKVRVMHKVVPVPFGEANPLPAWMGRWVNDLFFDGASDYAAARSPSDFAMLGRTFRNAICYEATCERLYAGDPPQMVAISNNAWFAPSTEATLQRLLMRLEAHRHGTIIYHATNGPGTGIVYW